MPDMSQNSLLSSIKSSDSSLNVQLHPLVLLTISDHITRHKLRKQQVPIVGAILGQQNGRELTMEVAFQCKQLTPGAGTSSSAFMIDDEWFRNRLEQYKEVHKAPQLDLVGWFALGSADGPKLYHLPIHEYMTTFNEAAVILLFDARSVAEGSATGGKLPLRIYEGVWEPAGGSNNVGANGAKPKTEDWNEEMVDDGTEEPQQQHQLRFRELSHSVETGGAEMIAVDFVAKGGANAGNMAAGTSLTVDTKGKGKGKGKALATEDSTGQEDVEVNLAPDEEELISSLTAKINAIKMLHSRLKLISAYLVSIPPCYLTSSAIKADATESGNDASEEQRQQEEQQSPPEINHTILRTISSLLARLPLLVPPSASVAESTPETSISKDGNKDRKPHSSSTSGGNLSTQPPQSNSSPDDHTRTDQLQRQSQSPYTKQIENQRSDVALINLLASMTRSLHATRGARQKHTIVENARSRAKGTGSGAVGMEMGMGGRRMGRMAGIFGAGGGRFEDGLGGGGGGDGGGVGGGSKVFGY